MPTGRTSEVRRLLALGLLAGLLPLVAPSPAAALCPDPAAAIPARCCGEAAPPSCPSCPTEGRSSCPVPQPSGARTAFSPAALPPGATVEESRDGRAGDPTSLSSETVPPAPARSAAAARRAAVTGASPPVRLLACTFRN